MSALKVGDAVVEELSATDKSVKGKVLEVTEDRHEDGHEYTIVKVRWNRPGHSATVKTYPAAVHKVSA